VGWWAAGRNIIDWWSGEGPSGKIDSRDGGGARGWLFLGRELKPGVRGCVPVSSRVGRRLGRGVWLSAMELGVGVGKRVELGVPRPIRVQGNHIGDVAKRREVLAGVRGRDQWRDCQKEGPSLEVTWSVEITRWGVEGAEGDGGRQEPARVLWKGGWGCRGYV